MAVVGLDEIDIGRLDDQLMRVGNSGSRTVTITTVELRVLLRCAREVRERGWTEKSDSSP